MAFETGVATDANDLISKLQTFLTTNAALVAASQAWTSEWTSGSDYILKGPGLSGTDSIYVGFNPVIDTVNADYRLMIKGMTGILSSSTTLDDQVNGSNYVGLYLDSNPMTYWFAASGRRFIVVVQISTVFEAMYGGLFLPYAMPSEYPLPLFVGGSRGNTISGPNTWRSISDEHSMFVNPMRAADVFGVHSDTSAFALDPEGVWQTVVNRGPTPATSVALGPIQFGTGFGVIQGFDATQDQGYQQLLVLMRDTFGGYGLTPMTITQQTPDDETLGILDGCYHVSGFNNASTNVVNADAVDHIVIQNVFRTGTADYWAMAQA